MASNSEQVESHETSLFPQSSQNSLHGNHMNNAYDPRISPNRSLSPAKSYNSSALIVALDPTTGRPQLPVMPTLPPRLRLSEDEDEEEKEPDDVSDNQDHVDEHATWSRPRAHEMALTNQHDLDLHSSSLIAPSSQPSKLHELIDPFTGSDYEKIESILSEMQSLQKARARTAIVETTTTTSTSTMDNTPNMDGISARTRGKSRATTTRSGPIDQNKNKVSSTSQTRVGGVGAILKPADKEELLSLIMTSLARNIQEADEQAWMFGAGGSGAGGGLGSNTSYGRDGFGIVE